jgi:hypothetical protein
VGKVTGVPKGLWGTQRTAIAVNQTILNTFNATLHEHRVTLQFVCACLLEVVYGEQNIDHALQHMDHDRPVEEQFYDHRFQISFPGEQPRVRPVSCDR